MSGKQAAGRYVTCNSMDSVYVTTAQVNGSTNGIGIGAKKTNGDQYYVDISNNGFALFKYNTNREWIKIK